MITAEHPRKAFSTSPWPRSDEPERLTVERFQAIVNWAAGQPGVKPEFANALRAASWLVEVEAFRNLEERFVSEGQGVHRVYLAGLIASGEDLVRAAKQQGMTEAGASSPVKFALEDLQATLDSLHTSFRCEYGPKNSEKTNELIGQLFDVSER